MPAVTATRPTSPQTHRPQAPVTGPRVRLAAGVRWRREDFGAVLYVARRDHFFALDADHAGLVEGLVDGPDYRWHAVDAAHARRITVLAELGVCETEPATPQRAFYGRSQIGVFDGQPTCAQPLVVNCFATAMCPLRCVYCHADDLMVAYRDGVTDEDDEGLAQVIRVARATPAMVGVVTGGEPLGRPQRSQRLIRALARNKAVVLDTSGVGDFAGLVPVLRRYGVHVRISMDSADPAVNDRLRPINRQALALAASSHARAEDTIRRAVGEDVPCSVQTVVTAHNSDPGELRRLRDHLVRLGITTWALHVVVPAGRAGRPGRRGLLSAPESVRTLTDLVRDAADSRVPLDIRVTSTHRAPNSVLLISADGELCVENPDGSGKQVIPLPPRATSDQIRQRFLSHIDLAGHASRYLNGTLGLYRQPTGAPLPRG